MGSSAFRSKTVHTLYRTMITVRGGYCGSCDIILYVLNRSEYLHNDLIQMDLQKFKKTESKLNLLSYI